VATHKKHLGPKNQAITARSEWVGGNTGRDTSEHGTLLGFQTAQSGRDTSKHGTLLDFLTFTRIFHLMRKWGSPIISSARRHAWPSFRQLARGTGQHVCVAPTVSLFVYQPVGVACLRRVRASTPVNLPSGCDPGQETLKPGHPRKTR